MKRLNRFIFTRGLGFFVARFAGGAFVIVKFSSGFLGKLFRGGGKKKKSGETSAENFPRESVPIINYRLSGETEPRGLGKLAESLLLLSRAIFPRIWRLFANFLVRKYNNRLLLFGVLKGRLL